MIQCLKTGLQIGGTYVWSVNHLSCSVSPMHSPLPVALFLCIIWYAIIYYFLFVYYGMQNSLTVIDNVLVDQTVSGTPPLTRYQFERCGFFCVDFDSTSDKVRLFVVHLMLLALHCCIYLIIRDFNHCNNSAVKLNAYSFIKIEHNIF